MAASVLIGCINIVAAANEAGSAIHIGGKVLCQDCTRGWNEWINGKPLKGNTELMQIRTSKLKSPFSNDVNRRSRFQIVRFL